MFYARLRSLRRAAAAGLILTAAACGAADAENTEAASVDVVDKESSPNATESELASWSEPSDSVLKPEQVNAYLRTTLLQFDLIRSEARNLHARAQTMAQREQQGGLLNGLRNVADAGSILVNYAELVSGSYVRSARSLGYNPAEMQWVQGRVSEVSTFLAMQPYRQGALDQARTLRAQAQEYRGQPGFDEATVRSIEESAARMEAEAKAELEGARAVAANLAVMRRARSGVSDPMWAAVGIAGGASGLLGLSGLVEPSDTTAQRQLDEWRRIYTDALANRVTPGMEPDQPIDKARPRLDAPAAL